jgi:hypothetical protein
VFVSPKEFKFRDGDIEFEGTIGAIQQRGERMTLSLGAAGRIAAKGQTLSSDKAASQGK